MSNKQNELGLIDKTVRNIENKVEIQCYDDLIVEAAKLIVNTRQCSRSFIQKKLKIGFNRAGVLLQQLESAKVVGPSNNANKREVLCRDLQDLKKIFDIN